MTKELNGYTLLRDWFDFAYENENAKLQHAGLFCFLVDKWNRLGQKEVFGLPTDSTMEACKIRNWRTYNKLLEDLVAFGFIKFVEKSKNQHTANRVTFVKNTKATTKALDKASQMQIQKQVAKQGQGTAVINKQLNKETIKQLNPEFKIIISNLNEKAGTKYKHTTEKTKTLIKARLNEGFVLDDFFTVIENKTREWLDDPKMSKYLRPETLFSPKFESYLNQKKQEENILPF